MKKTARTNCFNVVFFRVMRKFFYSLFISLVFVSVPSFADPMDTEISSPKHRYHVVKEIASGAFGQVSLVENELGVKFALKRFKDYRTEGGQDPYILAKKEFDYGQLLNHPAIIKSYELFDSSAGPCLILEFVEGQDFFDKFDHKIPFDGSINISLQFIHALRYALSFGLSFVDLNDGNIMLDIDGKLKLVDLSSFSSEPVGSYPFYIDMITDKCITFIRKSDLERDQKLRAYQNIKQISWNYQEDVEEGKTPSLDSYLSQLFEVLKVSSLL
jgi:serine/threonine protein kinase